MIAILFIAQIIILVTGRSFLGNSSLLGNWQYGLRINHILRIIGTCIADPEITSFKDYPPYLIKFDCNLAMIDIRINTHSFYISNGDGLVLSGDIFNHQITIGRAIPRSVDRELKGGSLILFNSTLKVGE